MDAAQMSIGKEPLDGKINGMAKKPGVTHTGSDPVYKM